MTQLTLMTRFTAWTYSSVESVRHRDRCSECLCDRSERLSNSGVARRCDEKYAVYACPLESLDPVLSRVRIAESRSIAKLSVLKECVVERARYTESLEPSRGEADVDNRVTAV
jgi:hypothetical protein